MNLARREVLLLSVGAAALRLMPPPARADALVPGTIHIVVGFPPGGVGSISARLIGQSLQQRLDRSVSSTTVRAPAAMSPPKP